MEIQFTFVTDHYYKEDLIQWNTATLMRRKRSM